MNADATRPAQLRGLTVDEAARRYVDAQVRSRGASEARDLPVLWGDDAWICDAMYNRGALSDDGRMPIALWFDLIVAAADHAMALAPDDQHAVLFGLGDGCSDHLVGEDNRFEARFQDARRDHPGIEAMFQVMRDDAAGMPWEHTTWWRDGSPSSGNSTTTPDAT